MPSIAQLPNRHRVRSWARNWFTVFPMTYIPRAAALEDACEFSEKVSADVRRRWTGRDTPLE